MVTVLLLLLVTMAAIIVLAPAIVKLVARVIKGNIVILASGNDG